MYHPAELDVVHRDSRDPSYGSFVGVRDGGGGRPTFVLPYGFDNFPVADPASLSRLFFGLYRSLREFNRVSKRKTSGNHDGPLSDDGGLELVTEDGEPAAVYSKIPMLEAVLDRYDELRIAAVLYRQRRTERIDYSQIHRYLHEAVYLADDVAFVDEMTLPSAVVTLDETTLVQMFCFVYREVKQALAEPVAPEVASQSSAFRTQHLSPDSALFSDLESHRRTVSILKEKLYEVDRQTRFKDHDYWHFYDALEAFLYAEPEPSGDGVHWGITSFSLAWEDMCIVWIKANVWDGVLYADTARYANTTIGGHRVFVGPSFSPPFHFELGSKKRYGRPDVVRASRPPSTRDKLDALFDIKPVRGGVRVRLTHQSESNSKWFEALKREVKKLRPGCREPAGDKGGTFKGVVRRELIDRAVDVLVRQHDNKEFGVRLFSVTDFKCVPWTLYSPVKLGSKAAKDVRKQIVYEYALQIQAEGDGDPAATSSILCVPSYFPTMPTKDGEPTIGRPCAPDALSPTLTDQDVEVFKADLMQVMDQYIQEAP